MGAKIAALALTLLINVAVGVIILIFMVIAMNGFGESDAMWGLGVYIFLALISTLLMGAGAWFVCSRLVTKQTGPLLSILIAVPVFSLVGAGLEIVFSLIGVGVAEFVRKF